VNKAQKQFEGVHYVSKPLHAVAKFHHKIFMTVTAYY